MMQALLNKERSIFWGIILLTAVLRLYSLTGNPPALHGDELGIGYNAYTILLSGKDEYGQTLPLVFRSDFTPLIFYATVPFVWLFGLSELSTRLPTALIGIATIPVISLLTYVLTNNKKLALVTMFLMAISPWHIRTSRIALELTWGFFLQILGIYFFLKSIKGQMKHFVTSFIFFGLSIFAYHSTKMTTPLLILALWFTFRKRFLQYYTVKHLAVMCGVFIVTPILVYLTVQSFSQIRFVGINVFTVWKNLPGINENLLSIPSLVTLSTMIVSNYLVHFSPQLLFFTNLALRYYHLEFLGLFYHWEIISIFIGLITMFRLLKRDENKVLLFLLLLAPFPAALTTGVPNANIGRVLLMIFPLTVLSATGVIKLYEWVKTYTPKRRVILLSGIIIVCATSINFFLIDYYFHTTPKFAHFWGDSYRQAAKISLANEPYVNNIIFSNSNPQAYMYVLFYGNKSPRWLFTQETKRAAQIGYNKIGKYEFRPIDWSIEPAVPKTLYIGTPQEIPIMLLSLKTSLLKDDALRVLLVD